MLALAPAAFRFSSAPLPDAALYVLKGERLHGLDQAGELSPGELNLSAPLLAALATLPAGATANAVDDGGAVLRLRAVGGEAASLWRVQSLADSRAALVLQLRARLAAILASQVLHDLRNPMNALSLHADLLARSLTRFDEPQQQTRAHASVQTIKTRLADLSQRQAAVTALWLADEPASAEQPRLTPAEALDAGLHLLRGLAGLLDLSVRAEKLERLREQPLPPASRIAQLALLGVLVMACGPLNRLGQGREVQVEGAGDDSPEVRIGPTLHPANLQAALGADSPDAAVAALGLLLEGEGIALDVADGPATLRWIPERVPA